MLTFRSATQTDSDLYFKWTNDQSVRENSLNTSFIELEDHQKWFSNKINNPNVFMYLFFNSENQPVGQVLIEKKNNWVILGQSVAKEFRGKKYSTELITKSSNAYLEKFPKRTIVSVVKSTNIPSIKMTIKGGFNVLEEYGLNEYILILKGFQENDENFIKEAKKYYNLR